MSAHNEVRAAYLAWIRAGRPGPEATQETLFDLHTREADTAGEEPERVRRQRIDKARRRRAKR